MGKADQSIIEPVQNVDIEHTRVELSKRVKSIYSKLEWLFVEKGIALFVIGFLLGRALILSHLTPFALPFFASVYIIRREKSPIALIGLLAGALTLSLPSISYTFVSAVIFLLAFRLTQKYHKNNLKVVAFYVFFTVIVAKLSFDYIQQGQALTVYNGVMALIEACLAFLLTYIFIQSVPLVTVQRRRKSLKTEEVVSLIILLASILTGTIGWSVYNLSVEHVLSRYLVLLFSFIAGATVGSTVGVVTGLVFSLANVSSFYQMSLLAFSGLLGGLMKEGKKFGAAIGLLIATLLMGMYGETDTVITKTLYESGVAILLLFLTPQSLTSKIAKHIPGTTEYQQEQQGYMRRVRDVTANRVTQFSSVFQALSNSFQQIEDRFEEEEDKEFDYFLSNVTEKTCQTCFKKDQCWARNFDKTYNLMKDVMTEYDQGRVPLSPKIAREVEKHCTREKKLKETIYQELTFYQANLKLKKQVQESRKLVADQLLGVSEVMGNFAKEIQRERENHHIQEEQILSSIGEFGIEIENIEIYNLEQGNVDIDMTMPYCGGHGQGEKLIAPMLSDILGENIIVQKEECAQFPNGQCHVTFQSAKKFVVDTGASHAAKGGGLVSGDSYSMIELGRGKYAVAISDGMGNGERAHYESNETLRLLKKILESGIEEQVAIKSINSILSLRTNDEIFSTLDLAMIDLQNASSRFLKIGSTPSFIKRGDKIIKVEASNLPMGMLQQDFDVDVVSEQLKAGDLLIMMSDGAFEGPKHVENYDLWMKRKIKELETEEPQEVADILMEEVIRSSSGLIEDDMTIVVSKIKHNIPKWSSIPVQKSKAKDKKKIS
ncbi:stage II sporulation protein E [Rossellomorea aquimaris]|jgi:stage II sporulation protein E|uniref:stage II sporulation protein E n=1 Tax=Bacillaceae TaxID=186817 RepID=UPI0011ED94AD|nr:stage II sporulation protein E [Bacillus sp. CH30_1T]KAA0560288.1 stage II sporulation protein E [Bacillus sp. CH30_1T]